MLDGDFFFIGSWESDKELFKPFPKLEAIFCKYYILIKIKFSMTCVYKEYEVKIKMAAAKNEVFIGFTIKIVICWRE